MDTTAKGIRVARSEFHEAYDYLLKCIRASLSVKSVSTRDGETRSYVPTKQMLNRVGNLLAAAEAIAELSGSWPPDAIIDRTELEQLDRKWQQAWERRWAHLEANPGRRLR